MDDNHGTAEVVFYKGCSCNICLAYKKAVNSLVDSFSPVQSDMISCEDEGFIHPMWSTVFIVQDERDANAIRKHMVEIPYADDAEDDMAGSGWSRVGDTGVLAMEYKDELILGINGAGFSFLASHWAPLYDLLRYRWHETELATLLREDLTKELYEALNNDYAGVPTIDCPSVLAKARSFFGA